MISQHAPFVCACLEELHTISELSNADETSHILVKDLEASTILFRFTWIPETARSVQDFGEGFEVNYTLVQLLL